VLFTSDAVSERFPGEITLYVVPLHTIVPWLPFTGSADAGVAITSIESSTQAASPRLSAILTPSFPLTSDVRPTHRGGQWLGTVPSRARDGSRVFLEDPTGFSHTDTCLRLSLVNGSPFHPP
jgi:hypothetical protein